MTNDRPARPPFPLVLALLLVLVQVGALAALTAGMIVELVGGRTLTPGFTAVLAAIFLGLLALLVVSARALFQGKRWGRGPVITWQLLVLAIGVSQADTLVWWLVLLLIALPVAVTVGLLVPPSMAWTNRTTPPHAVA